MRLLASTIMVAGILGSIVLPSPAQSAGFSDLISVDPEIRNAMDAAEAALESALTRGEVTRGASSAIAGLLYSADTLICAAWQISATQLERRIVVENSPLAPPETLLRAVMDLRNRIVAACDRILQPEYEELVPIDDTALGSPDLGTDLDDLHYLDGWGVVNDACYRQCFGAWLDWQAAVVDVERAYRGHRLAELRLGALSERLLPDLERETRRLERELVALRSRPIVTPEFPAQRDAAIAKAVLELERAQEDLARFRSYRDELAELVPSLAAELQAARSRLPALLAALTDCMRRCPITISWFQAAQEHRGRNGEFFDYSCDPRKGGGAGTVWGTDVYTDDSSICLAAVHAGLLTDAGGQVRIEILAGQSAYEGTERNGVATSGWGSWGGSFRVVPF